MDRTITDERDELREEVERLRWLLASYAEFGAAPKLEVQGEK